MDKEEWKRDVVLKRQREAEKVGVHREIRLKEGVHFAGCL